MNSHPFVSRIFFLTWSSLCLPGLCAGGMTKAIESVSPRIAQRGTTVDVRIEGISLDEPREIIFYKPGIRAVELRAAENPPRRRSLAHGGRIEEAIECRFIIAEDCPIGEHAFRLRTADELTCIATFHVTSFSVTDENEPSANANDTIDNALAVTPNVTVRGVMASGSQGDVDLYRVPVTAGQRLSVEVGSARIADVHYGDSEFDIAVRILDHNGRELAGNDDNPILMQDPLVSTLIPDGDVAYVEVRRSIFVSSTRDYCVHISNTPRPLAAFPPGGQAGTSQTVRFIGDASGDFERVIKVPESDGTFEYFGEAPSPLLLRSSPSPNVLEDFTASTTLVDELPAAINGIIQRGETSDAYRIHVNQGDRWHVRIYATSIGSPIDPLLRIRPVDADGVAGDPEIELDDVTLEERDVFGTNFRSKSGLPDRLDPSVIWQPKHDGDYVLELHDTSGGDGPTGVYRIEIERPRTVFQTVLKSGTFDWSESMRVNGLAVPQGNRWTVNFSFPKGHFDPIEGAFEVIARGLPEGMRLIFPPIPKRDLPAVWPVQFVADADAATGGAVFELVAVAQDASQVVESRSVQQVPFINHSGGDAWNTVTVNSYITAVVDPAPFSIELIPPAAPLVRGGELAIPVKVHREPGFDEPIEFGVDWSPPGTSPQSTQTIAAGETEGVLRISANPKAALGTWPLAVVANTVNEDIDGYLGAGRTRVCSEFGRLVVAERYIELEAMPESVRRGQQKTFVWNVKQKNPFEGEARVKLLGLPKGVDVVEPLPTLNSKTQQIGFQIRATDEALLGAAAGLSCEVTLEAEGQEIIQRTGSGVLRIDPSQK